MTRSRRRRAMARTIWRAAVSAGMRSHAGTGSRAPGWSTPRLSTRRISLSTNPGVSSTTATPRGASSPRSATANDRTAALLIAYAELPGAER